MTSSTIGAIELGSGDALLVVDVQNDFLPGGRLAVPRGDEVIEPLNQYIRQFESKALAIIASRDWHPPDHCSFEAQGGPWPPHCLAGSHGARFADDLMLPPSTWLVSKATEPRQESYSAFDATGLAQRLREAAVQRLFVGGLATEYCVLATVQDALREHFAVALLTDAIRSIDAQPGAGRQAIGRMLRQGAVAMELKDIAV